MLALRDDHCGIRWDDEAITLPAVAREAWAGGDFGVLLARTQGGAAAVVDVWVSEAAQAAGLAVGDAVVL